MPHDAGGCCAAPEASTAGIPLAPITVYCLVHVQALLCPYSMGRTLFVHTDRTDLQANRRGSSFQFRTFAVEI